MTTNINVSDSGSGSGMARDYTGRKTIAGLFTERANAEKAINDLKSAGFRPEDVGIAMRDRNAQNELIEDHGTKAAEGAGAGALGGGLLGGLVGFLVGIGALAIPGIGPVVAGGALATAFGLGGGTAVAGAGIGAAAGGIVGALVGMGIPEEEAKHFEAGFREGGVLITVNAGERAMDALAILDRNGADTGPGSVGARSAGPGRARPPAQSAGPPLARRPGQRSPARWAPSSAAPPAGSRAPRPGQMPAMRSGRRTFRATASGAPTPCANHRSMPHLGAN